MFVGNDSTYNESILLPESIATNQVAELNAGMLRLEQAIKIQRNRLSGEEIQQVVIKADSEYVVKEITEWIFK